ncbi:hypothetical protein E8E13_003784 [Curvularia kusanoi]|uniref:Xylanolytic transcriptional activator regulatory domain-containing protein n=1 Tax=Curvularia kusanoi TaxID=90978 RepID=A0A9P4WEN7_CURKU|nr:hypothetical protein E8E13_003784 [Curvularia kusanoi]
MGFDGPPTQRRRQTQDLSARQGFLPKSTSIEAILHTPPNAAVDDLAAEPRLGYVSGWTRVTDDQDFLAHLFTIWTERENIYYHFLDREAFLADMSSSRGDFCSELLVNAVLASACFHSSAVKDRNKPFSQHSIQTSFYYEARRLWDLENGKDHLTKVQAGMIMYLVLAKYGRDREGHKFLAEACKSAQKLGLFDFESPYNKATPTHISADRWNRARAVTAWAVYNFQLSMAITYSFPAIIQKLPSMPIPSLETETLFRSECALHIILLDCVGIIQDSEYINPHDAQSADRIEACFSRLRSWWYSRPSTLDPDKYPSQVHLLSAMQYNVNVVKLFRPVLDREAKNTEHAASYIDRARSAISASLREIRRLVILHDTHHGWSHAITFVMNGITVASFGTLDEISYDRPLLSRGADNERYQGLVTCLRALTVLLSYSYFAQPIFRLLAQKCALLGIELPAEIQSALDFCTSEDWTKHAVEWVSSQFIADTRSVDKDTETLRMDAIISKWDSLTLHEKQEFPLRKGKERAEF